MMAYNESSSCAGGGAHVVDGSEEYTVTYNDPNNSGQDNWKFCTKCYAMTFAGSSTQGTCPSGGVYEYAGSEGYELLQASFNGVASWVVLVLSMSDALV